MRRAPLPAWVERIKRLNARLSPNIRVQVVTSLLGGLYRGGFTAVWQPFVLYLGGSVTFLGLLESLGGWGGAISCLMQLLGGWLADRLGRRPVLIFSSLFVVLSFACFTLAAWLYLWPLLVPGVILAGMGLLGRAAGSSVSAESAETRRRGLAYGVTMFAFALAMVGSSIVGGLVSDRWGYFPVMLASLILEALVLVTIIRFLRETLPREKRSIARLDWRGLLRAWSSLLVLAIPLAGDSFSFGVAASILFGILKDAYRFTDVQLGWINAFFYLSWAVAQLPVGRLVGMALAYLLLGFTAALWIPALLKLVAGHVAKPQRGVATGIIFTIQGLARFPTPYLAAWLYAWWGYSAPLLVGLGGSVLVVIAMGILIREPPADGGEAAEEDAVPPR